MKWLKRLLIILGVLLAAALAVPFFIPLSAYIPEIEKLASERLHEPVKIHSLHIWLLPTPHVALSGIAVGKTKEIKIGKISIRPDMGSLFEPIKVLKRVDIDNVILHQDALTKIPALIQPGASSQQAVKIKQVRLRNLRLELKKQTLGPFNAEADIGPDNNLETAAITSPDEKLKITFKPGKDYYLLNVVAKKWQPPIPQPVLIYELYMHGKATQNDLSLQQINAKLYGGSATGKMQLSWRSDWKGNGEFHIKAVEIEPLVKLFTKTSLSGKLTADGQFSGNGKSAEQLIDNPNLNMAFSIADGVINNVDLVQAAKFIPTKGSGGGQTHFDELSGNVQLADKRYRLRNIKVTSGVLSADGNVDIAPNQDLSGTVKVNVKSGINLVSVPLAVFGTVNDPLLRPSTGAMAGAAAGTLLLGPVLGTSVGIKAGEFTENLFDKKEDDKQDKKQDK